jgi:predicted membrane protein
MILFIYSVRICKNNKVTLFKNKFDAISFSLIEVTISAFIIFSFFIALEDEKLRSGSKGSRFLFFISWALIFMALSSILFDLIKLVVTIFLSLKSKKGKKSKNLKGKDGLKNGIEKNDLGVGEKNTIENKMHHESSMGEFSIDDDRQHAPVVIRGKTRVRAKGKSNRKY